MGIILNNIAPFSCSLLAEILTSLSLKSETDR